MATVAAPSLPVKPAAPAGKQLGTLVVVVYRARNLPNKQRIGKQDPYCSVSIAHQKQRTEAIKRGGQTPRWDAQLQFEIWDDTNDTVKAVATESGGIGPAPPSPNAGADKGKDKNSLEEPALQATVGRKPSPANRASGSSTSASNKRLLKISCWADDPREPELIGEGVLDFSETLKKGEFDDWVELKHKGKYAGEVFLEMTFYSAAPPPVKRKKQKPVDAAAGYGGPGLFEPLPADFGKKPSSSNSLDMRPSSLSPDTGSAHSVRPSLSRLSLQSSTASSLAEFGVRPGSTGFPVPQYATSFASASASGSYNPPYAPSSLTPSASSNHLRPHRASMSSYGMRQHDIDSLTRPMSSLSVNSVNKPLPLPTPAQPQQSYMPTSAIQPPQPPPADTQYSQTPTRYYEDHSSFQHHPHRHSLDTQLPQHPNEPAYSNWNGGIVQEQPHQSYDTPYSAPQEPYQRPISGLGTWQDPRGPSPSYGQSSTTSPSPRPASVQHPIALQPGQPGPSSPTKSQFAPSQLAYPDAPQDFPSGSSAPPNSTHYPLDSGYQPHTVPTPEQPAWDGYSHGAEHHDTWQGRQQQASHYQQYEQLPNMEPQRYDNPAAPYGQPQHGYSAYVQPHEQYNQLPPPAPDPRATTPYRPLPAPAPDPWVHSRPVQPVNQPAQPAPAPYQPTPTPYQPSPSPYQSAPVPYQPSHSPYQGAPQWQSQAEGVPPQPPPPRQPRFGLPPHQSYDPPYQPPYSTPPPVPPIPAGLRQDYQNQPYG